jgi:hypothetical protein
MTRHDQLWKDLVRAFFGDFVRIVVPRMAQELRLGAARFLKDEYFTDVPRGRRQLLDLVAEVESRTGDPEIVLVHVEVEARTRKAMERRMWRYAMQLRLRHCKPVVPIALHLRGGAPDVTEVTVEDRFAGIRLASFTYFAFGLSRSEAQKYLERPEPLAWGLAALMRRGTTNAARHLRACLRPIARDPRLDEARRFLLVNCVKTYVQLDEAARAEYDALLAAEGDEEVRAMEMTWADRIRHEGMEVGMERGRQEGRQEGREEGKRDLLLEQLERRFGPLPPATVKRVRALTSSDEISRLAARVLDAPSLEDLGL